MSVATTKNNTPELRFHGFSSEWQEKRLSSLGKFVGGGTPSKENKEYWQGDIPWISSSDILEDTVGIRKISRYITEKAVKESATQIVPEKSVLIVSRVGVGKFAVANKNLCTSQDFTNFITDGNPYFFAYNFLSRPNRFLRLSQGTSIMGVSSKDIKKIKIYVPLVEEQQKIASFLVSVDSLLNNLKIQKAKLEEYKRGMMQKIFSQEVRFKDDNGKDFPEWQTFKLGDLLMERTERAENNNYDLLSVTMNNGVRQYDTSVKKDGSSQNKSNYKVVRVGDIAYNTMRMWQGASGVSKYEGIVSPAYTVATPKNGDSEFFGYLFKMPRTIFNFYRYSQGLVSDTWNLKFKHFSEVEVSVPTSIDEQVKIKNFIKSIDDLIYFKSKQIEKAETWKRGLLQKMLV